MVTSVYVKSSMFVHPGVIFPARQYTLSRVITTRCGLFNSHTVGHTCPQVVKMALSSYGRLRYMCM